MVTSRGQHTLDLVWWGWGWRVHGDQAVCVGRAIGWHCSRRPFCVRYGRIILYARVRLRRGVSVLPVQTKRRRIRKPADHGGPTNGVRGVQETYGNTSGTRLFGRPAGPGSDSRATEKRPRIRRPVFRRSFAATRPV
jgi:hypothetical protein